MKKQIAIILILVLIFTMCTMVMAWGVELDGVLPFASGDIIITTLPTLTITPEMPSSTLIPSTSVSVSISPDTSRECTCCGITYDTLQCPYCLPTRCSVCGLCPNHCKCENLNLVNAQHAAYINGFEDGTFRPEGTLTRAQAATIFYKLLQNKNVSSTVYFRDVSSSDWYYTYVTCLASKGIINGYPDGTFRPNGTVTRAEFIALAAKFSSSSPNSSGISFSDVPSTHWAYDYISIAVANGWIENSTGAFNPDKPITRQDAVHVANGMTHRSPDMNFIRENKKKLTTFKDVTTENAYYYEIIEAANGHVFSSTDGVETWSKKLR